MIRRGPRKIHFTILPNQALEDDRLSFKARGLLAYVLSKPDNWRANSYQLATAGPDGRDAIRSALAELEAAGYAELQKARQSDGTFVTEWEISEECGLSATKPPLTGETGGKPATRAGLSGAGSPGPITSTELTSTKTKNTRENGQKPVSQVDAFFEEAWSLYPKKVAKQSALRAYKATVKRQGVGIVPDLLRAVKSYSKALSAKGTPKEYVLHPSTFFGPDERWREWEAWQEYPQPEYMKDTGTGGEQVMAALYRTNEDYGF